MERISGDSHTSASGGTAGSQMHLRAGGQDDEENGQQGSSSRMRVVTRALRHPLSMASVIRERPLMALGVAFSAGFVMAVSRPPPAHPNWAVERTRRRLRAALLSGLTAVLAEEVRELVTGEESLIEFLRAFVDDEEEEGFSAF